MNRIRKPLYVFALLMAGAFLARAQAPTGIFGNLGLTAWSEGTSTSVTAVASHFIGTDTGAPTGNATYTTDTATNFCALFPQVANSATFNYTWDWYLGNTSNFPIALSAGSGVTIAAPTGIFNANLVMPNSRRHFKVTLNNCSTPAVTIQGFEVTPSYSESYGSTVAVGPVATGSVTVATFGNAAFAGIMGTVPTGAETLTTDTATNLCAVTPVAGLASTNGFYTDWYLKNTSAGANTATMAGGTGVTLVGTGTATQNNVRHMRFIFSNCAAGTQAVSLVSLELAAF